MKGDRDGKSAKRSARPFGVKNDIGTGIHMIIHYNCTIGSILLHSFLLIYHPYPPSFHEMIFTLVYISHMHAVCRLHTNIIIKTGVRFIIVCIGRINNQSEVRGQSVWWEAVTGGP